MGTARKILRTLLTAALLVAGVLATFSAFSSQTESAGNNMEAGSVALSSNGTTSPAYAMSDAAPGESSTPYCITATYTGSLDAEVRLYTPSTIGALGEHVTLLIETGAQATPTTDCSGFSADGGAALFDDTLNNLPTSFASGVLDQGPGSAAHWGQNDSVTYRVTATLAADAPMSAQNTSTGLHALRFEAQNQ
jgi:hypothetical protein